MHTPIVHTESHSCIENQPTDGRPATQAHSSVGGDALAEVHSLNERHEQWLREQYLRDVKTLERIEFQNACFFDAMGALAAKRGGDGA